MSNSCSELLVSIVHNITSIHYRATKAKSATNSAYQMYYIIYMLYTCSAKPCILVYYKLYTVPDWEHVISGQQMYTKLVHMDRYNNIHVSTNEMI